MKYGKPEKIISLLNQLISSDVEEKKDIINEIHTETMKTEFRHYPNQPFVDILYKKLLWFGTRDYLHSNFSIETEEQLREAIDALESSEIVIK